jgi:hypothetical protein
MMCGLGRTAPPSFSGRRADRRWWAQDSNPPARGACRHRQALGGMRPATRPMGSARPPAEATEALAAILGRRFLGRLLGSDRPPDQP